MRVCSLLLPLGLPLLLPLTLGLFASLASCAGDGEVGAPCTEDADCEEGLICDEHEGQGSCQEAHDHETGQETGEHDSSTGA